MNGLKGSYKKQLVLGGLIVAVLCFAGVLLLPSLVRVNETIVAKEEKSTWIAQLGRNYTANTGQNAYSDINKSTGLRERPHLVIHVGPPKTATTTLQTALTHLQNRLSDDNYVYAGRYYNPFVNSSGTLIYNRTDSDLVKMMKTMFSKKTCERAVRRNASLTTCTVEFLQELDRYKGGQNLLISDEALASRSFEEPRAFAALREAVQTGRDPLIIIGYRRFFQWMRSDIHQQFRFDRKIRKVDEWPGPKTAGRKVPDIFPILYRNYPNTIKYTTSDRNRIEPYIPVQIFNMHGNYGSIISQFACNMLPDAPQTCQASKGLEQSGVKTQMNVANSSYHWNYDKLTVGAAELGLIDTERFSRRTVREDLMNFTRNHLKLSAFDFELDCPSQEQLQSFLTLSLDYEKNALGSEEATRMEAETRAAFSEDSENYLFCAVAVNETVSKEPWKSFFAQYALV